MLSSFRAWHVCVSSWDTCWSVFTNSKWMNLLQVAAAGRLRSYRPVPRWSVVTWLDCIPVVFLCGLPLLLPGSRSCINHASRASVSKLPPVLSLSYLHYSLQASHALQLRLSSVLRLGPKHQSGSRCHLVNLPSQILHQHLSTLPAPSPPLLCTVLRWAFDTRNLSLPTFTTSSFTFPPASCSFTHFHWSFCTHTVAQCLWVSQAIQTSSVTPTLTFLFFLTSSHSITGLASALLYIFCRWDGAAAFCFLDTSAWIESKYHIYYRCPISHLLRLLIGSDMVSVVETCTVIFLSKCSCYLNSSEPLN